MDDGTLAVLLGLSSALTLAAANLAVKVGGDVLVGRAVLSTSAALLIAPALLFVPAPDAAVWQALAWAVPAHWLYQLCLVRALQRGQLSLVFPVMRGLSPLLTAGVALLVLHERLSIAGWCGLALASAAVAVFAWPPVGTRLRQHPDRAALGWAAATAVGIALYNSADANGVRTAPRPETYIVWLFLVDWIGITAVALAVKRWALLASVAGQWRPGLAAGALSILSFGAALYAMALIETAKVSALRETAVLWAALLGAGVLKEGLGARRIGAAVVLVAGLALLQLAG
ncbi:MAG: EamA family transporter [Pseudomonadota bacterium]